MQGEAGLLCCIAWVLAKAAQQSVHRGEAPNEPRIETSQSSTQVEEDGAE